MRHYGYMRFAGVLLLTAVAGFSLCAQAATPEWITRSNENAQVLLKVMARFGPEGAGSLGVEGLDQEILDMKPQLYERSRAATEGALAELKKRLAAEKDPLVRQDLEILIDSTEENLKSAEISRKYFLPYTAVAQTVFGGMQGLLDEQVAESRRPAALVRLKKYTGLEQGYTPITELAMARYRERLKQDPNLQGPPKAEVEQDLVNSQAFVTGIGVLLEKFKVQGYSEAYAKLRDEINQYNDFVKKEVLPKSRTDFRLPPEVYAMRLKQVGVDISPAELTSMAHAAFNDYQQQMQKIAAQVAKQHGFASSDYRDVIHELKKDQLVGDAILPHYKERLAQIEDIIRREHLVTLPGNPARIVIASAAETAQQPAPHMKPPRLLNNHGEVGQFVLPLNVPSASGKTLKYDDFTFAAASWTLTAHEARPGHELQFDRMVENGVSVPRAVFAFNSVNVEGWGLYSEYITFPYMPLEGQLISLQHRMMRAARAFL